ncbi:hypothetical protein [Thalassococcus sp. S3]|uniref:hypothetical protein n=1 Tax=Thalassococcus sp. S3 TaxID=2017482 RepID=UPI0010244113|nr:hypothetical protein [Thalassococcus sp. S3]QBF31341.1 hypothetical protein CFI11_08930 [Thalassococcus sp. S3]
MAALFAFGPLVIGFSIYLSVVLITGAPRDWSALGPILMALAFILNFWQARELVRRHTREPGNASG